MSSQAQGVGASIAAKWAEFKPVLTGAIIGLVAGPIISGFAGFQVRTSTAQAAAHAGMLEQQASICAAQAHAETAATATLGWQAQNDLARRHAAMPGSEAVDPEVVYACAGKLSR